MGDMKSISTHYIHKLSSSLLWTIVLIFLMGCSLITNNPFKSSDPRPKPNRIVSVSQTIDGSTVTLSNFRIVDDFQKKYLLLDACVNNPNHYDFSRMIIQGTLRYAGGSKYISTGLPSSNDPACDEWSFYFYSDEDLSTIKITIQSIINADNGHSLNPDNVSWEFTIPQGDYYEQGKLTLGSSEPVQLPPDLNMRAGPLEWGGGENVNGKDGQAVYVDVCFHIPDRSSWMIWDAALKTNAFWTRMIDSSLDIHNSACNLINFQAPQGAIITQAEIEVYGITSPPGFETLSECINYWFKLQKALFETNYSLWIKCSPGEWNGYYIQAASKPAWMSAFDADQLISNNDLFTIHHTWRFELTLP